MDTFNMTSCQLDTTAGLITYNTGFYIEALAVLADVTTDPFLTDL